jgi:hypothetical protein
MADGLLSEAWVTPFERQLDQPHVRSCARTGELGAQNTVEVDDAAVCSRASCTPHLASRRSESGEEQHKEAPLASSLRTCRGIESNKWRLPAPSAGLCLDIPTFLA